MRRKKFDQKEMRKLLHLWGLGLSSWGKQLEKEKIQNTTLFKHGITGLQDSIQRTRGASPHPSFPPRDNFQPAVQRGEPQRGCWPCWTETENSSGRPTRPEFAAQYVGPEGAREERVSGLSLATSLSTGHRDPKRLSREHVPRRERVLGSYEPNHFQRSQQPRHGAE